MKTEIKEARKADAYRLFLHTPGHVNIVSKNIAVDGTLSYILPKNGDFRKESDDWLKVVFKVELGDNMRVRFMPQHIRRINLYNPAMTIFLK